MHLSITRHLLDTQKSLALISIASKLPSSFRWTTSFSSFSSKASQNAATVDMLHLSFTYQFPPVSMSKGRQHTCQNASKSHKTRRICHLLPRASSLCTNFPNKVLSCIAFMRQPNRNRTNRRHVRALLGAKRRFFLEVLTRSAWTGRGSFT